MHSRLYLYLERKDVFHNLQFDFRNGHSTALALLEITEKTWEAYGKGFFTCGVCLYFKKVFHTVIHPILVSKLEYYGVRGIANDRFQSFLTNKKQFTNGNDYNSTYQQITHGIPQGFVLGPLLFILCISDLYLSVNNRKVHHFADDTNLLFSSKSFKKMNSCINHDLALLIQ